MLKRNINYLYIKNKSNFECFFKVLACKRTNRKSFITDACLMRSHSIRKHSEHFVSYFSMTNTTVFITCNFNIGFFGFR